MRHRIGLRVVKNRRRRGIALVIVCSLILLVLGLVVTIGSTGVQNLSDVALQTYEKQAVYVAEAGLQDAVTQVKATPTWSAGFTQKFLGTTPYNYTVTVLNNYSSLSVGTASDGTLVPPGGIYLRSTGGATRGVTRTVSAIARLGGGTNLFNYAIFGQNSVSVGGFATVDGYDSTQGAYASHANQVNAPIGTNSTAKGAITLGGASSVDGNLVPGPGAPANAVQGANHATGGVIPETSLFVMPTPVPPSFSGTPPSPTFGPGNTLAPGIYGGLSLNGGTVTLTGGTYYFAKSSSTSGSVSLGGNATLALAPGAAAVIYFDGTWDSQGGNISNPSGSPANLVIYGTRSAASVTPSNPATPIDIAGGPLAFAVIYAPGGAITVHGNAGWFGAVIGNSMLQQGNPAIHFDTSLTRDTAYGIGPGTGWALTAVHLW